MFNLFRYCYGWWRWLSGRTSVFERCDLAILKTIIIIIIVGLKGSELKIKL